MSLPSGEVITKPNITIPIMHKEWRKIFYYWITSLGTSQNFIETQLKSGNLPKSL